MSCLEMMQNVRNLAPITFHDSYLGVMGLLSWLEHYGSGTPNQSAETNIFRDVLLCTLPDSQSILKARRVPSSGTMTPCCQDITPGAEACWGCREFETTLTPGEDAQSFAGTKCLKYFPLSCRSFSSHYWSFSVGCFATAFSHSSGAETVLWAGFDEGSSCRHWKGRILSLLGEEFPHHYEDRVQGPLQGQGDGRESGPQSGTTTLAWAWAQECLPSHNTPFPPIINIFSSCCCALAHWNLLDCKNFFPDTTNKQQINEMLIFATAFLTQQGTP